IVGRCKTLQYIRLDLHPNLWRPQTWGLTHHLFVSKWAQVVESGMSPGPIIKGFDVIKGDASGLRSCLKGLTINAFPFETVKKAFHGRIIVTIGRTTHACYHAFLL